MEINMKGLRAHGFSGPVDYIEKITYAIWNLPDRDPSLVGKYYTPKTAIHLDSGDLTGGERVTANTWDRLAIFPDFHGVIDDTIWTGSEEDGYRTSMRWAWTGTDMGGTAFGDATGKPVTIVSIANCVIEGQHITEEWLGTNPLSLVHQLGHSTATALAASSYPRHPHVARPSFTYKETPMGNAVVKALDGALCGDMNPEAFSEECSSMFAGGQVAIGTDAIESWSLGLRAQIKDMTIEVDDQYALPQNDTRPSRVATQARVQGMGPAGPIEFSLTAHHHLFGGKIIAQWILYDELSLTHQGISLER